MMVVETPKQVRVSNGNHLLFQPRYLLVNLLKFLCSQPTPCSIWLNLPLNYPHKRNLHRKTLILLMKIKTVIMRRIKVERSLLTPAQMLK
jgi:hypothetical protein